MVKLDITKYVEIQGIGKKEQMLSISLRWGGGRLAIFKYY
jgi:hypothetical protein